MDGYKWKDIFTVALPGFYFIILAVIAYVIMKQFPILAAVYGLMSHDFGLDVFLLTLPIVLVGCLLNFWSSQIEKSLDLTRKQGQILLNNNEKEHHLSDAALSWLKQKSDVSQSQNGRFCDKQAKSALHYVAEVLILCENTDKIDEYYTRKIMCRNICLTHILMLCWILALLIFYHHQELKSIFYNSNFDVKFSSFIVYNFVNFFIFIKLWHRYSKRYIQIQLTCYQMLFDSNKIKVK